jgi:SAM-dependent methyltransferase
MLFHPGIASLALCDLPSSEKPIQMLSSGWPIGATPPQDLFAILRVVRWLNPKRIFEIGTSTGITTAHLAMNSEAEVYTLDLPRELADNLGGYNAGDLSLLQLRDQIGSAYRPFNRNGQIRQLFGDSRTFDFSPYRRSVDLVFVDGCHVFDGILSDSRNAFDLLGERGVILWHDFANLREVTRAVKRLASERPLYHLEGTWLAMYVQGVAGSSIAAGGRGVAAESPPRELEAPESQTSSAK